LNKIAEKIDYSRVLGLNSTVITIKNWILQASSRRN
jgi:hypothetical protein